MTEILTCWGIQMTPEDNPWTKDGREWRWYRCGLCHSTTLMPDQHAREHAEAGDTAPKKEIKIFHDDVRPCPEGFMLARDNNQCLNLLWNNEKIAYLTLDHDLGASPDAGLWARGLSPDGDGRDLAREMVQSGLHHRVEHINIHSWNFAGAREMALILKRAGHKNVTINEYKVAKGEQ